MPTLYKICYKVKSWSEYREYRPNGRELWTTREDAEYIADNLRALADSKHHAIEIKLEPYMD